MDMDQNEQVIYEGRPSWRSILGFYLGGLVLVAAAVVATAVLVTRTTSEAKVAGYTQLWMLPSGPADARQLVVGIRSGETREQAYRLEVQVGAGDLGRVIGRRGRTAQSIRSVVRAAATRDGVDVDVDFVD